MIKSAWGDFYQFAPPLDTFDKGLMSGNELSFFSCSLRVFCKAFLKNWFSRVNFPPHLSSLLILWSSASSWVGSLFNLPLAYCFFQWYTRPDERLCLLQIWAGPVVSLSTSSTTCRLNSAVKVLGFLIDRLLSIPLGINLTLSGILTTLTHFVQL